MWVRVRERGRRVVVAPAGRSSGLNLVVVSSRAGSSGRPVPRQAGSPGVSVGGRWVRAGGNGTDEGPAGGLPTGNRCFVDANRAMWRVN